LKKGYIEYFYTIFNASIIGYSYYNIFLEVNKITQKKENEIISFLINQKNCSNIRVLEGQHQISFLLISKGTNFIQKFIQNLFAEFGNVILKKDVCKIVKSYKINQKIFYDGENVEKFFKHIKENIVIDELDLIIIKNLLKDARINMVDLAKKIGETPTKIIYRRKKLEQKGIIVGYATKINTKKIGYDDVRIDISLSNYNSIDSIIEFFNKKRVCLYAYEMIGSFDLALEVIIENDESLRKIMNEFKEKYFDDFRDYKISQIYKECVSTWSPFKRDDELKTTC
jgi:DNA-binding Lrp family transcriptional regulator